MVLLITFEMNINNIEGIMNLCILFFTEPVASKLVRATHWAIHRTVEHMDDNEQLINGRIRQMIIRFYR